MKIYHKTCFFLGVVCVMPIIHECKNFEGIKSVIWTGFFLYMMICCFVTAFSEESSVRNEPNVWQDMKMVGNESNDEEKS